MNVSPLRKSLDVTVWFGAVLSHKSLIKSHHEEARHDLGLQCKLWPEPNALLYHPGQDGGGSLSLL